MQGIYDINVLDEKISRFKKAVGVSLPDVWDDFFQDLRAKINPLKKVGNLKVYKVPEDNTDLINLIARDMRLKELCLKAEGFYIIVPNKKLRAFKSRLQEFGYLIE